MSDQTKRDLLVAIAKAQTEGERLHERLNLLPGTIEADQWQMRLWHEKVTDWIDMTHGLLRDVSPTHADDFGDSSKLPGPGALGLVQMAVCVQSRLKQLEDMRDMLKQN